MVGFQYRYLDTVSKSGVASGAYLWCNCWSSPAAATDGQQEHHKGEKKALAPAAWVDLFGTYGFEPIGCMPHVAYSSFKQAMRQQVRLVQLMAVEVTMR